MKKQILFIHSAGKQGRHNGSGELIYYLQDMLGDDYEVLAPQMPAPENPRYLPWKQKIEKEFNALEQKVILVGHSLGGSVLLKFLLEDRIAKPVAGLFLIAAAYWGKKNWEIDEFTLKKDYQNGLSLIPKLFLYHSREDQWVPFKHLEYYSRQFPTARVRVLEGSQHEFYYGLPELVYDIQTLK